MRAEIVFLENRVLVTAFRLSKLLRELDACRVSIGVILLESCCTRAPVYLCFTQR